MYDEIIRKFIPKIYQGFFGRLPRMTSCKLVGENTYIFTLHGNGLKMENVILKFPSDIFIEEMLKKGMLMENILVLCKPSAA